MTRDELIAALQAASGPSREFDHQIHALLGWKLGENSTGSLYFVSADGQRMFVQDVPHYTSSLDAAMTLVPKGVFQCMYIEVGLQHKHWNACGITRAGQGAIVTHAKTLTLAVCIAAVKAMEGE